MSKRNRRKRYTTAPAAAAIKDVNGGTFWGPGSTGMFTGAGVVGRNTNLSRTEWGAATAYQIMPEVNRAMSLRADALGSLPWQILNRDSSGTEHIIASSEDVVPRHPLAKAMAQTIRDNNHSLLSLMCYSHDLAGEIFVQKTFEPDTGRGLNWLNPLATEPLLAGGEIINFQYSQMYGGKSEMFKPREVAYYHNWNPYNDFRGQGLTQVVMQKINIARNLDDFIEDFFGNNARPSVIVSPTDDEPFTQNQKDKLQQQMDMFLKGRGNQFATYVSPVNAKYTPLEQPEIGKHYTIAPELSQYIYTIYGVPKALAGDDSGTQYKTGDDVKVAFFQITIIPLSTHFERFINAAIMPYFDTSGAYFRFDTTEFDLVSTDDKARMDIAGRAYDSGLWTRNKGLEYTKADKLGSIDFLKIDGMPIPLDEVSNYYKLKLVIRPTPVLASVNLGGETVDTTPPTSTAGAGGASSQSALPATAAQTPSKPVDQLPAQIPGKATQVNAEDELRAWRKVAVVNYSKALKFETFHLSPLIKCLVLTDLEDIQNMNGLLAPSKGIVSGLFDRAEKSLKSEADYQRSARALSRGLWSEQITQFDFLDGMNSAITRAYTRAFYKSVEDQGLSNEDLTPNDRQQLDDLINTELTFVPELMTYIVQNAKSKGGLLTDIRNRVELWIARYDRVADVGKLVAGSLGGKRYKWNRDPAKESCTDCINLEGRVYMARTWLKYDIQPHSPRLKCFGTNCGCGFAETDEPITQGRPPDLHGKSIMLDDTDGIADWREFMKYSAVIEPNKTKETA